MGGFLMRIGWVRAKGPKGLPSLNGETESNGNGNGSGNGSDRVGPIAREEWNDLLLELGDLKRDLGKLEGRLKSKRDHCEHCYQARREA